MSGSVTGGAPLSSALLGVPAWTALGLLNSWANTGAGAVTAQWRKLNQSNEIEVIGDISGGTGTTGTTIGTISLYLPATAQPVSALYNTSSGAASNETPVLTVDTSGNLKLNFLPTGTTRISFHGTYSLDA